MSARRHPQSFVEGISELASDDIRTRFRHLPNGQRWNVLRFSQRVLNNRKLKKDGKLKGWICPIDCGSAAGDVREF